MFLVSMRLFPFLGYWVNILYTITDNNIIGITLIPDIFDYWAVGFK
jgi:hypothetical protein